LHKQNVSIFSKNLGTKPKLFVVFQLFFSKSKMLLYNPKIFRSERKRFGAIMNFVSKTNIFDFFGDVYRKTKANDKKRWFDITIWMIGLTLRDSTPTSPTPQTQL
jgi:hypothetical protein